MKVYYYLLKAFLDLPSKSNLSFLSFPESVCHPGHSLNTYWISLLCQVLDLRSKAD